MIKSIENAGKNGENMKIVIENFKKTNDVIITSEKTSIELDTEVNIFKNNIN